MGLGFDRLSYLLAPALFVNPDRPWASTHWAVDNGVCRGALHHHCGRSLTKVVIDEAVAVDAVLTSALFNATTTAAKPQPPSRADPTYSSRAIGGCLHHCGCRYLGVRAVLLPETQCPISFSWSGSSRGWFLDASSHVPQCLIPGHITLARINCCGVRSA